jgi:adenosylmethionine-8-amino-7-oxononanoate aminotransferase
MKELSERDTTVIWHPYTQMKNIKNPITIEKGEGAYLYDEKGKRYIDAISSWWVNTHGHCNKYIAEKVHLKKGKPEMYNVISGKLDYLKMVKGADNELYLKLKNKFELLIGFEDPINRVLNVWEADGIEQAMDFYYKDKLE